MARMATAGILVVACGLSACGHHTRVAQIDYPDRAIWIEPKGGCIDHAELYDWLKYIESQFGRYGPLPINFWGVSPHYNRITFGVESSTNLPAAAAWFDKLGVPCWLVAAEVVGPFGLLDRVERPPDR